MKHVKQILILLSFSLNLEQDDKCLKVKDHDLYRWMISRMMFMIIETWIDIVTVVNWLSQYLSESCEIHLQAVKHLLHYLRDKIDLEILYKTDEENLIIFTDAVYANIWKFKSIIRFCVLIADDSVTWTSHKQTVTAQSTTESKYMILTDAAKQAI